MNVITEVDTSKKDGISGIPKAEWHAGARKFQIPQDGVLEENKGVERKTTEYFSLAETPEEFDITD